MLMLFLTVALVHIVALMSPGPDFFFVSQTAVSRSRKEAMMGVMGITAGVMVWAGVALLGLHLILEKMAWLHNVIMVGGGLYLCWMGYQMLRGALKKEVKSEEAPTVELASGGKSFVKGLLTNLANPKAIIYFGSVFSLFVGDNVGSAERWGLFVLIAIETFAWFSLVASLFALPKMRRGYQRLAKWIDGMAGALFTGFGIHLIISR
ncbi:MULTISPECIES: threonine export protein RhtC [Cedecea]|uniref:Threonine efflux protein n=2 Tax=Cedecea davisae TaxID=158484 RepID=S3IIQ8_9ENTR|nr:MULTISPECIES: threonine export protein RhtC [Cedecea]EPF12266.1 threonine efflux protein [Cedecea davisae DSM 4568]MBU4680731.1 threonine export protein RhtC [Cedecea davisae]MBU4686628.1 threonine export protein RhtC [Cedecea davisae]QIX95617.1 threonine export protein RhtC [Cedecea sp. FDAARGOS_727]SUX36931.1 Threonine efflux protein [Cedecea davisae]